MSGNFMVIIKDIAATVGCLLSCVTLITLCVKPMRKWVVKKVIQITHTEEINKQNDRISAVEERISAVENKVNQVSNTLDEIKNLIFVNERDRLRGELFNFGNRCRRGIKLTLEEFRYIQTVGNKYLNALHCNSIGEEEYNYICSYYQSEYNQNLLKNLNKNV